MTANLQRTAKTAVNARYFLIEFMGVSLLFFGFTLITLDGTLFFPSGDYFIKI
jgi:hypothetical protein